MSDVLQDLAVLEAAIKERIFEFAVKLAKKEDAAMTQALAEAMTYVEHIYMETLSKAQQKVALLRLDIGDKWPDPNVLDSYIFLVSEIGEVGDALLRSNHGHRTDYSRNNTKYVDVAAELGDVYLMLCTLATSLGISLDDALQGCIDKLRTKYDRPKSGD